MSEIKLGDNLAYLRRKKGITQEVLADFLGVTKASVSKWETGLSMPDIVQLPRLASYYGVSIDRLMSYEAWLSKDEIKAYYEKFSKDFAKREFTEVMDEVHDFIREYYSCYPAMLQIVVLMINHYALAQGEMQMKILEEMESICQHIRDKCGDADVAMDANMMHAAILIMQGKPEGTIEKLEPHKDIMLRWVSAEGLLTQAYHMVGRRDAALEFSQILTFNHLMGMVESSMLYIMNIEDRDAGLETIRRVNGVMELYNLRKLHPNTYLRFYYAAAEFYSRYGMKEEAVEALKVYAYDGVDFIKNALYLHGDDYFDRLDNYIENMDLGPEPPRNWETVLASLRQSLDNPIFDAISNEKDIIELKGNDELWNS